MHPSLTPGSTAVITGAASGIGFAMALALAARGIRICLADLAGERLDMALAQVRATGGDAIAHATDVSNPADVAALADHAFTAMGQVNLLMNNAGIQPGSSIFDPDQVWPRIIATNMMGVIQASQLFGPRMIASGQPGLILNTGSKQGITTPPGDPAYNVSKAAVKVFTEALQHSLRNIKGCQVEARLFIPGYVHTPLTAHGRADKPDAAWTPQQVVDFLLAELQTDTFYILCPDNDVSRSTDEKRIRWAADDIVLNRPALSRWHPDYAAAFQKWMQE